MFIKQSKKGKNNTKKPEIKIVLFVLALKIENYNQRVTLNSNFIRGDKLGLHYYIFNFFRIDLI
jgi:hypothetical protein